MWLNCSNTKIYKDVLGRAYAPASCLSCIELRHLQKDKKTIRQKGKQGKHTKRQQPTKEFNIVISEHFRILAMFSIASYPQTLKLLQILMKFFLDTHDGEKWNLVFCKTRGSKVAVSNCLVSIVLWTGQVLVE